MNVQEQAKRILQFQQQQGMIKKEIPSYLEPIKTFKQICLNLEIPDSTTIDLLCEKFGIIATNNHDWQVIIKEFNLFNGLKKQATLPERPFHNKKEIPS